MPTLSTPASPSPLTEDGDHLLVELREFLQNITQTSTSSSGPRSRPYRHAQSALRLLRQLPVAREAVLDYFSSLIDMSLVLSLDPSRGHNVAGDAEELSVAITDLQALLVELLRTNGPAWAPFISQWTLSLLGEMSSRHAALVTKNFLRNSSGVSQSSSPEPLGILEALPIWLNTEAGRILADVTVDCISTLRQQDDSQTEKCVSSLLEASFRHGPHFDWVVAHVGGCFPDTVISRVLAVGLKDFVAHGTSQKAQIAKEGSINLARVPKISSVVGILGHLGGTHEREVFASIRKMVAESLAEDEDEDEEMDEAVTEELRDLHIATIPYFLYLSSLSDMISSALLKDVLQFVDLEVAGQIEIFVPDWIDLYFPGNGSLLNMAVHLAKGCRGLNGRDLLQLLFDFSGDISARQVTAGCRLILEHLLSDLMEAAHQSKPGEIDVPILKSCHENFSFFVENYFLASDSFRRKSMLNLAHIVAICKGRPAAVYALNYGLLNAKTDDDVVTVLQFIRDTELWVPGLVDESVLQSVRSVYGVRTELLLDNLGKILQFQMETDNVDSNSPSSQDHLKIVSKFSRSLEGLIDDLLPMLSQTNLIPKILKIFYFVNFPSSDISVALTHRTAQAVTFTLFKILKEKFDGDEKRTEAAMFQCTQILSRIASRPAGLPIVLRHLVEGAIATPFAQIFGGNFRPNQHQQQNSKTKRIFEENLKFGSMPTQPLGTSTVFHAGIIGEGKRWLVVENRLSDSEIETNTLFFVSILFKLCHCPEKGKEVTSRQAELERREQSKEACKQLALLLVDLVSPDVMYNGLPWPDEEFTRVTVERDLKINITMNNHPILWKILWGLAEARPALCYCSVLLRACLAVQMYHWQSSVNSSAAQSPVQLETTRKILQLMSIGQFVPPPLDGVSEIIDILHPFHLHCILVDIWNYVRDNVPSPAPFSCNASGVLARDFEPYKNYKQYCERLRLILMKHITKVPKEFKRFFIQISGPDESQQQS